MRRRSAVALIALGLAALTLAGWAKSPGKAVYVGSYRWTSAHERFGGFSGLELSADGARFWTVGDGGILALGQFQRDAASGMITGTSVFEPLILRFADGEATHDIWDDAEGLAVADNGDIFVSFEGIHRIWRFFVSCFLAPACPSPPDFGDLQYNSALTALASDASVKFVTLL